MIAGEWSIKAMTSRDKQNGLAEPHTSSKQRNLSTDRGHWKSGFSGRRKKCPIERVHVTLNDP